MSGISRVEGTSASVPIEMPVGHDVAPYRYDVLESVQRALELGHDDIQQSAELIKNRAEAVASFLRDATKATSTRANLSLQTSVERLTLVTIAISVVALVAGVLPEEGKEVLFQFLLSLLQRLRDVMRLCRRGF